MPTEAFKHLGDWDVDQIIKIFNAIMQSDKISDESRQITITTIYKDINCLQTWYSSTWKMHIYDTVPREVLWRCMRKRNIPKVYIRLVQDMYQDATTCVQSKRGIYEHFEVGIGLHQGSALSPFLFMMVVDTISRGVRSELPRELLYADDLAIIDFTSTDTQNRLESLQTI